MGDLLAERLEAHRVLAAGPASQANPCQAVTASRCCGRLSPCRQPFRGLRVCACVRASACVCACARVFRNVCAHARVCFLHSRLCAPAHSEYPYPPCYPIMRIAYRNVPRSRTYVPHRVLITMRSACAPTMRDMSIAPMYLPPQERVQSSELGGWAVIIQQLIRNLNKLCRFLTGSSKGEGRPGR